MSYFLKLRSQGIPRIPKDWCGRLPAGQVWNTSTGRHPNQIKCLKLLAGSFLMQRSSSYTLRKSHVLILFLRVNPDIKEGNGTVCQGHSKNDEIPVGCIQTRWATHSEFRAIVNPGFIFCSVTTQKLMARWGMEIRFTSKFRNSRSVSSLPWQADDESTCWSHAPSSWTRPWETRTLKVTSTTIFIEGTPDVDVRTHPSWFTLQYVLKVTGWKLPTENICCLSFWRRQ